MEKRAIPAKVTKRKADQVSTSIDVDTSTRVSSIGAVEPLQAAQPAAKKKGKKTVAAATRAPTKRKTTRSTAAETSEDTSPPKAIVPTTSKAPETASARESTSPGSRRPGPANAGYPPPLALGGAAAAEDHDDSQPCIEVEPAHASSSVGCQQSYGGARNAANLLKTLAFFDSRFGIPARSLLLHRRDCPDFDDLLEIAMEVVAHEIRDGTIR